MPDNRYETALTHSSWAYEQGGEHNERLEFLGDAVLQLCVSHLLCEAMPGEREGELSRHRQRLVNRNLLARLARDLRLDRGMRVGNGPGAEAVRTQTKPLSDTWEALLGAVYLETGLEGAMDVVRHAVMPHLHAPSGEANPKSRLQEWSQRTHDGAVPAYRLVGREGPDNAPVFAVEVVVAGRVAGRGQGGSKKEAERAAAAAALQALGEEGR